MASTHPTPRAEGHIRPLDPFRDVDAVVDLVGAAFKEHLDPAGKATLARMRRFADSGPMFQWAWTLLGSATVAPGLVWVVDDRVVGNVSVRRASGSPGYLIGNVVVDPEQRGQGIASALMRRAIQVISRRGAPWVGLEVRASNSVARRLYERLDFLEVGRTYHWLRPRNCGVTGGPPQASRLRRGRATDADALLDLMKAVVPERQRPLLELQASDYRPGWVQRLEHWLRWEDEVWWVVPGDNEIEGAVRALRKWGAFPHRMEVLVRSDREDPFETDLVIQGLAHVRGVPRKPVEVSLVKPTDRLLSALEAQGFRELRVLIQMRRKLRYSISTPSHS